MAAATASAQDIKVGYNGDLSASPSAQSGQAAVLGMGALHLGTDGGGSIRIPAGFTGIFGLKQSYGLVPASPLSPLQLVGLAILHFVSS